MAATPAEFDRMTRLIRLCFQRLRAVADALHADLGISASLRAVLEALHEKDERTVPQIAKEKSVSRQHIQKIVDVLLAGGHVTLRTNTGHKRSPRVALTARGRKAFAEMRRREAAVVAKLAGPLPAREVAAALAALQALEASLQRHLDAESRKGAPA